MDNLFEFFEKLDIGNQNKLLVSIFGFVFPSLACFLINFTDKFFKEDILKTIIFCVSINFIVIVITVSIEISINLANSGFRHKKITKMSQKLEAIALDMKDNSERYEEKETIRIDEYIDSFSKYVSGITDINSFVSYSSAFHIVSGNIAIIINQFTEISSQQNFIIKYLTIYVLSFLSTHLISISMKHKIEFDNLENQFKKFSNKPETR